jgi:hypothetical protein
MATTLDNFTSEKLLTTAFDGLVAAQATEKKFIGKATFTNTSTSPVEVTVWRIATATTPTTGSGGNWTDKKTIQPGKVWECDKIEAQVLGGSMSIFATAATTGVINANLSGVTES